MTKNDCACNEAKRMGVRPGDLPFDPIDGIEMQQASRNV